MSTFRPRLLSRNHYIPGGFRFHQPETGWNAPGGSFYSIVDAIIAHRRANPAAAEKANWSLEQDQVADELDYFNAKICTDMGWFKFVMSTDEGQVTPKISAPSQSSRNAVAAAAGRAKKIWAGVKTLNSWIDSGKGAVSQEVSTARAGVCASCPRNTPGDFTTWFTKPAAGAIARQLERMQDRHLSTPHDDKINVCDVCLCPLKLKVHTPIEYIRDHLTEEVLKDLERVKICWIPQELRSQ